MMMTIPAKGSIFMSILLVIPPTSHAVKEIIAKGMREDIKANDQHSELSGRSLCAGGQFQARQK